MSKKMKQTREETALRDEIDAVRAADIKAAIREAASDPLFLADLEETGAAFSWVDSERDTTSTVH